MKPRTETDVEPQVDAAVIFVPPFKARIMNFGCPIWFVVDAGEKWVCRATPANNQAAMEMIATALNKQEQI